MIMVKGDALGIRNFTCTLPSVDGEHQLTIITSWGQDGKTRLVVVSAEVDGGVTVVYSAPSRYSPKTVVPLLTKIIDNWMATGVKLTPEQQLAANLECNRAMEKLCRYWGVEWIVPNRGVSWKDYKPRGARR